jgi:hypothetical protein
MTTPLSAPAYYLAHYDGEVLETEMVVPGQGRRPTFFVYSSVERLRDYARLSGTNLQGFNIMAFETLEDVEHFVEEHRDFYEYVVVNPELGGRAALEPFERLLDMARELAVED